MLLRGLAMFAVVSVFGMGCGGAEVTEGTEQLGEDSAELAYSCEVLQTRRCTPDAVMGCNFADGTPGDCFCQAIPHNKWVCLRD
ncbi:hypothetical protein ACLESD_04855 [Pyxidicoccus sp. 3LFB2]